MMPSPTVVLFQTHFFDGLSAWQFGRLRRACPAHFDVVVLMHAPPGTPVPPRLRGVPHHFVTTPEVRDPAYPRKSGGANWSVWGGGHPDLIMLHFAKAYPEYERYWLVEYDVRFSGSWATLFTAFEDNDADFLTTSLRTAEHNPDWSYWETLHQPGACGPRLTDNERTVGFPPIYRASRAAVNAVDAAYRAGWGGHCEVTWPTIVRRAGLRIEDMGGNGPFTASANRGRFYTNNPTAWSLGPGGFTYKPARYGAGLKRNMLWHPVKPPLVTLREDMERAKNLVLRKARQFREMLAGQDEAEVSLNTASSRVWRGPKGRSQVP